MNHSIVRFILLKVLAIEGACMMLPVIISLIYHESQGVPYLVVAIAAVAIGLLGSREVPEKTSFYSKEGLIIVGLSWVLLTIVGGLPFFITREIPSYIDCIFETPSTARRLTKVVEVLPVATAHKTIRSILPRLLPSVRKWARQLLPRNTISRVSW